MNIKKGIVVTAFIVLGIYAVQTVSADPQMRELVHRFVNESGFAQAGVQTEPSETRAMEEVQTSKVETVEYKL